MLSLIVSYQCCSFYGNSLTSRVFFMGLGAAGIKKFPWQLTKWMNEKALVIGEKRVRVEAAFELWAH